MKNKNALARLQPLAGVRIFGASGSRWSRRVLPVLLQTTVLFCLSSAALGQSVYTGGQVVTGQLNSGTSSFYDTSWFHANVIDSVNGATADFYDDSSVQVSTGQALSSGVLNLRNRSRLEVVFSNGVTGGSLNFYDTSMMTLLNSNAIMGGIQSFYGDSRLVVQQEQGIASGTQNFLERSRVAVNVSSGIVGGLQKFYEFSSMTASQSDAISGGTQLFYDNSMLSVQARNALTNDDVLFYDRSSLNIFGLGQIASGTVDLTDSSVLYANNSSAITGGTQAFSANAVLNAQAAGAIAGGTQTFVGLSRLNALADGAISNGVQNLNGSAQLTASVTNAVSGGQQTLLGSSVLNATATAAVSGGRQRLADNSRFDVLADQGLQSSGTLEFSQNFNNAGTLSLNGHDASIGSIMSLSSGAGIIRNGAAADSLLAITGANSSFSGSVVDGGNGRLALQLGTGSLTLAGSNQYSGGTTVNGGLIVLGNNQALGSGLVTLNGGSLQNGLSELLVSNDIVLNSGSNTLDAGEGAFAVLGALSGTGSLIITGKDAEQNAVLLAGQNTYSGTTTVSATGTLFAMSSGALSADSAYTVDGLLSLGGQDQTIKSLAGAGRVGNFSNSGASTATLTLEHDSGTTIFSGSLSDTPLTGTPDPLNALSLIKNGNGTQILSGSNTYSGNTTINGGTLQFGDGTGTSTNTLGGNVAVNSGATLAILSPATLTVAGDVSLGANSNLKLVTEAATPALSANSVQIDPNATLNISGIDAASADGRVFIDTQNGISGSFIGYGVGSSAMPVDYLTLDIAKSADNKQYLLSYKLAWTAGLPMSSGTFTLTDAAERFTVGATLSDQTPNALRLWDGATLVKEGQGTLVLTGNNDYSGGTWINAGTVQIGDGGTTGSIASYVVNDGILAFNRSDTLTFGQSILGSGSLRQDGSGTLVLSGVNTYQGGTDLAAGVLSVSQDASLGAASGGLRFDGGTLQTTASFDSARSIELSQAGRFEVAAGTQLGLTGTINGPADLIKSGAGTLTLSGINNYGNTLVQAGTLIADVVSLSGDIGNAGTVILYQAGNTTLAGNVLGLDGSKGRMVKRGVGALTLTGYSTLDWTIESGSMASQAQRFTGNASIGAGAALSFDDTADASYAGRLSGSGAFNKLGSGTLLLTGNSAGFAGTTTVAAGGLIVGASATDGAALGGSVEVLDGGLLGGHGSVGSGAGSTVRIASGGTLSPGNSIGTLTVNGDLSIASGSRFLVETDPASSLSDLVHVTGTADIQGGSLLHVGATGNYQLQSTYRILSADGGLTGAFDSVSSDFAFLNAGLVYGSDSIDLKLERNDVSFAAKGDTRNQRAAAAGLDSVGIAAANGAYDAVAQLPDDAAQIRGALDQLSGEIHASAKTALIEQSRFVRDAATGRLRIAFADADRTTLWGQGLGNWGKTNGNGNAARLNYDTGGFLFGADTPLGSAWRVGALAGYSRSTFKANERASSGDSDNYHLGLYAGTQAGAWGLRSGLAYTWHDINSKRNVGFQGYGDQLKAGYQAGTFQAFGDLGYRIDAGRVQLEPFANLAYVSLRTGSFKEQGGDAALQASGQTTNTTYSTLGLRAATGFTLAGLDLAARGSLGWRHAYGDITPLSRQAFAGGNTFSVAGVPIAKNSAAIELGLESKVSSTATLALSYDGQLASGASQHGLRLNFNLAF